MKRFPAILLSIVVFWAVASTSKAGVVVNEVMANEPGSSVTLEWIELYNNSSSTANLAFDQLVVGATEIGLSGTLAAGGYMVVCRRLLGSGPTPGFETVWGNNSGQWGDSPLEQYPVMEASFSLANSSDSVILKIVGQAEPPFSWTESGRDGVSWERVLATSNEVKQSKDYSGSTPGFVNSVTPLASDLAIDTTIAQSHGGMTDLLVTIENVGQSQLTNRSLLVYDRKRTDSLDESDTLAILAIQVIDSGFKTDLTASLSLSGLYHNLGLKLQDDDRMRNNRRYITVPGANFPPFKLSEFLANPALPLTSEWVEIRNRLPVPLDLAGWQLCDLQSCYRISDTNYSVPPDSFLILTQDSVGFRLYYGDAAIRQVQLPNWPALNNENDQVILLDSLGNVADHFAYNVTYSGNFSWAESDSNSGQWGRSADSGGTPGKPNRVLFAPSDDRTELTITPPVFSPDGDGIEDQTVIGIKAVAASGYTLRIFDRIGRVVKQFFEDSKYVRTEYGWDGRSDGGNRLPVGIYIVYFDAIGVEQVKKTVVIAR